MIDHMVLDPLLFKQTSKLLYFGFNVEAFCFSQIIGFLRKCNPQKYSLKYGLNEIQEIIS